MVQSDGRLGRCGRRARPETDAPDDGWRLERSRSAQELPDGRTSQDTAEGRRIAL
jgi:hypothetical protein